MKQKTLTDQRENEWERNTNYGYGLGNGAQYSIDPQTTVFPSELRIIFCLIMKDRKSDTKRRCRRERKETPGAKII